MRISREAMFMEMARVAAKRATCARLNVGAIIIMNNTPISIGWNGTLAGEDHCQGNACSGMIPGGCPTVHAEVNALKKLRATTVMEDVHLYLTHSPCKSCCDFMRYYPYLTKLYFEVPYRETAHLEDLQGRGMGVYQITQAGYVTEFFSRKVVSLV